MLCVGYRCAGGFSVIDQAALLLSKLAEIGAKFQMDAEIFTTMLKITGVAYIAEFGVLSL